MSRRISDLGFRTSKPPSKPYGKSLSLLLYDVWGTHDPSTFLSNETTNPGKTRNEDKVAAHRIVQIANDILERKWLGRARMR